MKETLFFFKPVIYLDTRCIYSVIENFVSQIKGSLFLFDFNMGGPRNNGGKMKLGLGQRERGCNDWGRDEEEQICKKKTLSISGKSLLTIFQLVAGEGFSHNFTFPTIRIPLISDKKIKSLQSKQSPPKKVQ